MTDLEALASRLFWWKSPAEALANPPAGVFDPRSWSYWHVRFGLEPPLELPKRKIPA